MGVHERLLDFYVPLQHSAAAARRRGVHGDGLLCAKAVQIVRAARLGAGATQAFTAERLHPHDRANLVAIDVDIAHMGRARQRLGPAVDAGLNANSQAVAVLTTSIALMPPVSAISGAISPSLTVSARLMILLFILMYS